MAKKRDLKSMVSGVLEAGEGVRSREVERRVEDMAPAPVAGAVLKLPLDRIYPDRNQPRRTFPQEGLEELAASIREQGVLEPIQVIATDEGYLLLHGERRWRAARMAGLSWIPSIIHEQALTDADRLTRQLIENIQREDLNDVDRAVALERLKQLLDVTWEEVAEKVGLTVGRIHQLRRLSRLAPEIQEAVKAGELSEKDTRPYQGLSEEEQLALHRARQEESLSPDEVREVSRRLKGGVDMAQAIREIQLERERARTQPPPPTLRAREPFRAEAVEVPPAAPAPPPPWRIEPIPERPPEAPGVPAEREYPALPTELRRPEVPAEEVLERPSRPFRAIPEEPEPYADVETERLLRHLERLAQDFCTELALVVRALRQRPLASWERKRIEAALSQTQEALAQLGTTEAEQA